MLLITQLAGMLNEAIMSGGTARAPALSGTDTRRVPRHGFSERRGSSALQETVHDLLE